MIFRDLSSVYKKVVSSVDLVIAGANDIVQALLYPSPNSPLAPLADSEVAALRNLCNLTTILLNRQALPAPTTTTAMVPTLAPTISPAPVSTPPATEQVPFYPNLPLLHKSTLRSHTRMPTAPLRVPAAAPLRVLTTAPLRVPPLVEAPTYTQWTITTPPPR
jgi:hypothetical protein